MPLLAAFATTYPSQYLGDTFEALLSAASSGYTVAEVAVPMRPRLSGRSTASRSEALKYASRAIIMILLGARTRMPTVEQSSTLVAAIPRPRKEAK